MRYRYSVGMLTDGWGACNCLTHLRLSALVGLCRQEFLCAVTSVVLMIEPQCYAFSLHVNLQLDRCGSKDPWLMVGQLLIKFHSSTYAIVSIDSFETCQSAVDHDLAHVDLVFLHASCYSLQEYHLFMAWACR